MNGYKELTELWSSTWKHMDYKNGMLKDGNLRIPKNSSVKTEDIISGAIEISIVARTEDDNIRIDGYNGACVIFNWEGNKKELRVTRPDGDPKKNESGTIVTAKTTPLVPNQWYSLRWQIHPKGMAVFVNDQLIWSERKPYKLEMLKAQIGIRTCDSVVDVKEVKIRPFVFTD